MKSEQKQFIGSPTGIQAPHGASIFEITWPGGLVHRLPHEILRGYCPCAGCQGHSGKISFVSSTHLELRDIKMVGNYALSLIWGDSHSSGIYSFEYLHRLGMLYDDLGAEKLKELTQLPSK